MLKMMAEGTKNGKPTRLVILGLSKLNVERMQAGMPIHFDRAEVGLPNVEFTIFTGSTEPEMAAAVHELIGPTTRVKVDPRYRN